MNFSIKSIVSKKSLVALKTECLVVGVFENKKLSTQAEILDQKNEITEALNSGDISGKAGTTLLIRHPSGALAKRILLVGCGPFPEKSTSMSDKNFVQAAQATARILCHLGAGEVTLALPDEVSGRDLDWVIRSHVMAFHEQIYRSDALKSKPDSGHAVIKKIGFVVFSSQINEAKKSLMQNVALAHGINLAKTLGNLPANICTPTYLEQTAKELAENSSLSVQILERKQLQALKMGSFLSVTNGSDEPPKLIIIKYLGGKANAAPVVLVGKGITFDSGGISLKPGSGMDEMKYDMCGAASVLGTMRALSEMKLSLNVIGVIPACENMPSGGATKPGDIVTSMSGQTIEVLNTDAEGRLILCDALTYVERFKPAVVIDIATLTGACVTALGHHNAGLFTRHDPEHDVLAEALLDAGKKTGDTAWRMPIEDAYQEQLKSNFADIANIGGPAAGSVTAACFLERFTKKYTWAHLDIAGVAWRSGSAKGATGRPVALLTAFLIKRASK